ncbi:MAG: BrnT family toxin [Chloroflexi bacterium]|nr:BrnT family toxin [Chloroflexota bacterium]
MIDLGQLTGFDWGAGNRDKNWQKHQVSTGECEEVFFNLPLLFGDSPGRSANEKRYFALGQTNAGRLIFIAFTVRDEKIRVISARDMSEKERGFYDQSGS